MAQQFGTSFRPCFRNAPNIENNSGPITLMKDF